LIVKIKDVLRGFYGMLVEPAISSGVAVYIADKQFFPTKQTAYLFLGIIALYER